MRLHECSAIDKMRRMSVYGCSETRFTLRFLGEEISETSQGVLLLHSYFEHDNTFVLILTEKSWNEISLFVVEIKSNILCRVIILIEKEQNIVY